MDNKSQQVETAVWRLTNGRHREQLEKEAAQAGDAGELHLVLGMLVDERHGHQSTGKPETSSKRDAGELHCNMLEPAFSFLGTVPSRTGGPMMLPKQGLLARLWCRPESWAYSNACW